jgi:hypothetical protein
MARINPEDAPLDPAPDDGPATPDPAALDRALADLRAAVTRELERRAHAPSPLPGADTAATSDAAPSEADPPPADAPAPATPPPGGHTQPSGATASIGPEPAEAPERASRAPAPDWRESAMASIRRRIRALFG